MDEPRLHHYIFAHRLLPGIVRRAGIHFILKSKTLEAGHWIRMWNELGDHLDGAPRVPPGGLSARDVSTRTYDAILFTLPEPAGITEAHFVLVISKRPRFFALNLFRTARYLTLEYGVHEDGTPRTVLCEWKDGTHVNLGDGPPSEPDAFVRHVERHVL